MKKMLEKILMLMARVYLKRHHPVIIAVTGNVGKTSAKEAIACVLSKVKRVRMNGGNLNNEIGVPLTILGDWSQEYYDAGSSVFFWLKVLIRGALGIIFDAHYPELLVLEFAADRPGDIGKLVRSFHPHVGVITAIGEIPVHVEYFDGPEELAREKAKLIKNMEAQDYAVLNHDDQTVYDMRERTKAHVYTFGFDEHADIRISNLDFSISDGGKPEGVTFKLHHEGSFVPVKLLGSLGKAQAYAAAAGTAVGLIFDTNLIEASEALALYHGPKGRLRILRGVKETTIIDDTYNAAPASMHLALETLKQLGAGRKIAVLGDMLELGKYSIEAHRTAGNLAGEVADTLVCVGERARFIADSAANQMSAEHIFQFDTAHEAKVKVQELIKSGDVVLVKGSQGMRMERIVEEIMAEPERKKELLVRQSKKWQNT